MINETRKILGKSDLAITATTVRVPVFNSHCESINIEFEFQHHKMVRLYFMKYVFDKKVGVKTKSSGLVKRICGLTCEAFEKYLEEYIIQYKKVKIFERKYFMNGDFYECKDTE